MKSFFVLLILCSSMVGTFLVQAQVDTIRSEHSDYPDTIVIYEDPVILSSQVEIYKPEIKKRRDRQTLFFALNAGSGTHFEYHDVCEECVEYEQKINASTARRPSYYYNAQFIFSKRSWVMGVAIGGYEQQARFSYTAGDGNRLTVTNSLKAIDGQVSLGYWIGNSKKNKKISFIPSFLIVFSKPFEVSGRLYRPDNTGITDEWREVQQFNSLFYGVGLEGKWVLRLTELFSMTLSPAYRYDIKSIVNRTGPFTIQRHVLYCNVGILLGIK